MTNYRKLWEKHYGTIPKDENGNSYDIHHIDGNRENNKISNLKALSIKEHYEIHYKQGDWSSAILISKRLNMPPEEREYLRRKMQEFNPMKKEENKAKLRKPKPPGFGKKISLLKKGVSIITKGIKKGPQKKVTCPHCNKTGGASNMKVYHFNNCKIFTGKQKHDYRKKQSEALQCPHCGLIGRGGGGAMKQWHFDNCKKKI